MKAGEAVCFDDSLLHYTGPNKTDQPREAIQLVVKPKEAPARFYYRHLDKAEKMSKYSMPLRLLFFAANYSW